MYFLLLQKKKGIAAYGFSRLSILSSWSWSTRQSLYGERVLSSKLEINYAFFYLAMFF